MWKSTRLPEILAEEFGRGRGDADAPTLSSGILADVQTQSGFRYRVVRGYHKEDIVDEKLGGRSKKDFGYPSAQHFGEGIVFVAVVIGMVAILRAREGEAHPGEMYVPVRSLDVDWEEELSAAQKVQLADRLADAGTPIKEKQRALLKHTRVVAGRRHQSPKDIFWYREKKDGDQEDACETDQDECQERGKTESWTVATNLLKPLPLLLGLRNENRRDRMPFILESNGYTDELIWNLISESSVEEPVGKKPRSSEAEKEDVA